MFSLLFSLLPLSFLTLFLVKGWLANSPSHKTLPPSPPKLPIIGNLHQLGPHPHLSLSSLAQTYGPLMLLRLGRVPVLVVSSAAAAREILKTHDQNFCSRPKSRIADKLLYGSRDVAFSPYGEYWRQVRSVCVLHLLSHKMVQSFRIVREEETTLMVEKIRGSSVVNLSDMLVSLTNSVISRVTLGRNYWEGEASNEIMYVNQENEKANEFSSSDFEQKSKKTKSSVSLKGGWKLKEMIGRLAELLGVVDIGVYIPWLSWLNRINGLDGKAEKLAREFDEFIEAVVAEHVHGRRRECNKGRGSGEREVKDFVDVLLELQSDDKPGFPIHGDTIKALILDMFGAGTDTTFTLLEWTVAELLKHQETMKKLQKEVKEIGRGKRYIAEDDLEKMHYLKAVIKECLRLHTPLPILLPRESLKDVRVMGYDIDAGTQVLVNVRAIARDPSSWEHPEEFRPERFLNSSIDFKGKDFEFIPFGAGRRGCPGTLFAINVTELALANIVYKFDLSLPDGASSEDLDMSEGTGITIHRKNPLIVLAAERL